MGNLGDKETQPISRAITEAAGVRTHYFEAGKGNPEALVLLHGMSSSADTFRELMLECSQQYWTVAPDIPGFGESEGTRPFTIPRLTAWLQDFMAKLELGPVQLAGHSFGGALAVNYAMEHPSEVRSLILLAPSVLRPGKYPEWLRKLAGSPLSEWVLGLGVSASRIMLQRQMRAAFYDPSQFGEGLWRRSEHDYRRARASAAVLRASALHDMRDELHNISQPSCIVWGQNDPILAVEDAFRLNALMPQSSTELHLLPECGHVPHIEKRQAVVRIIHDFLDDNGHQPGATVV